MNQLTVPSNLPSYDERAIAELVAWHKKMIKSPSLSNKISKEFRIRSMILFRKNSIRESQRSSRICLRLLFMVRNSHPVNLC
jgi:hypothetical protein